MVTHKFAMLNDCSLHIIVHIWLLSTPACVSRWTGHKYAICLIAIDKQTELENGHLHLSFQQDLPKRKVQGRTQRCRH